MENVKIAVRTHVQALVMKGTGAQSSQEWGIDTSATKAAVAGRHHPAAAGPLKAAIAAATAAPAAAPAPAWGRVAVNLSPAAPLAALPAGPAWAVRQQSRWAAQPAAAAAAEAAAPAPPPLVPAALLAARAAVPAVPAASALPKESWAAAPAGWPAGSRHCYCGGDRRPAHHCCCGGGGRCPALRMAAQRWAAARARRPRSAAAPSGALPPAY